MSSDAMAPPVTLPPQRAQSPIHNRRHHHHQSPRPISNAVSLTQHIPITTSNSSGGLPASATPTELLQPPEWITAPQSNVTPLRSFVNFMQRQFSELVGGRNEVDEMEEDGQEVEEEGDQAPSNNDSPTLHRAGQSGPGRVIVRDPPRLALDTHSYVMRSLNILRVVLRSR
ncbi:hypothetical protein CPB83DRAFT_595521 [Crepidotus variabilis]|uniref:Uncharacterized protein n=1 Tax=Crepidotus variabilis TaxID=179855 RepID=A0A9P6JLE9_9AGAR|nr:hypothetical protein CPB83DRAFT_595521 [Crepidotus variabilis]